MHPDGRRRILLHMPLAVSTPVWVAILGFVYLMLLITLGITAIRKGHWLMFVVGIFLPIFWVIGALMPPTDGAARSAPAH
jgi:hypothetical protein